MRHISSNNSCNLVHILHVGERSTIPGVQSCANLAHILCIGEISTILHISCVYIAHWGKKYNLAQILRIYCALGENLAHILRIDTSNAQLAHLTQNTIRLLPETPSGENKVECVTRTITDVT